MLDLTTMRTLKGSCSDAPAVCRDCQENMSWCAYNCRLDDRTRVTNVAALLAARDGIDQWDNQCAELADELLKRHPGAKLLWVEPLSPCYRLSGTNWHYHAVIVLDGIVHDAWHPEAMLPPDEYVAAVFGEGRWEINPGSLETTTGMVLKKSETS